MIATWSESPSPAPSPFISGSGEGHAADGDPALGASEVDLAKPQRERPGVVLCDGSIGGLPQPREQAVMAAWQKVQQ
eukprot:CAMPEP_0170285616 /NCGR_PEP_ID=MMETSP0116_2-20130129/42858_1 /TAXON_ID=400756 /ORGANISM="Durinskia baltica, Strain CSIRO CS-38" /LENGTH=76 /DNA_ID=CAMNT_0010537019 /DNA_START=347 /DNA_END=575 /DNA_ORIENTATION=+